MAGIYLRRNHSLLLALLAAACCGGCRTAAPTLDFVSQDKTRQLSQTFTQSYAQRSPGGSYDVVLVREAGAGAKSRDPLAPSTGAPLRQVLHARVHWQPRRGAYPDTPASTNATLHWYLLADPTDPSADRLEYTGSAFVRLSRKRNGFVVTMDDASLSPTVLQGDVVDPLGPVELRAKFYAFNDPTAVKAVLDELPEPPRVTTMPSRPALTPSTRPAR